VSGAVFANVMWVSYLWPVVARDLTFLQQVVGITVVQPIALMSAAIRFVLWGPSLALWMVAPQDYSFGKWLAPGLYAERVTPRAESR
jgi:hypothetical protein